MSLPKIIKTTFYVDPSHGRNYQFDVNQNITMGEVKGMLVVASKVAKIGLRIFHKETEKEYTNHKNETLEELFPKKDSIEFVIKIDNRYRNQLDYDQLKLGANCQFHPHKYCFFYCFDCEQSLCSLCIGTGAHKDHAITEKFDYLKPSNEIVDSIFADLDGLVKNVDSMNTSEVEDFKLKLKMDYFPSLVELLKKIELKMQEQIEAFNKHYEINLQTIKHNSSKLKEHCSDGLDELKHQIDIENMLKDEGVFLHFDYKVKELSNQKQRIYDDTDKIEKIIKSFSYAKAKMENMYEEIKIFLQKQLSSTVYDEIKQMTTDTNIKELSKDSVLSKLLSEFKKKNGKFISEAKPIREGNLFGTVMNSAMFNNILNTESKANPSTLNNINMTSQKESTKAFTADNTVQYTTSKSKNNKNAMFIMKIYEGENKLVVYNDTNQESESITDRVISFKPDIHGCSVFLKNSAIVNNGKLLYISGGEISHGVGSNVFLCYNPQAHILLRLDDLPASKYNHSMICNDEFVISVGGYNSNSFEKYEIKLNKWTKMPNLRSEERQRPILYINGNWLYAFFGYKKGSFLDTIERFNLKSPKAKWENVMYKNTENVNCAFIGAACISTEEGIFMIGGKDSTSARSSSIQYDFNLNSISECLFKLEEEAYFKESIFIKVSNDDNALFNENNNQLLKLNMK